MNKGPGVSPLIEMKLRRAATGQRSLLVRPRYTVAPDLNGSVFEALMRRMIIEGSDCESRETSDRWTDGSYPSWDCVVASPDRRKPKKQVHDAAHSIDLLNDGSCCSQARLRRLITPAVTGRRADGGLAAGDMD